MFIFHYMEFFDLRLLTDFAKYDKIFSVLKKSRLSRILSSGKLLGIFLFWIELKSIDKSE